MELRWAVEHDQAVIKKTILAEISPTNCIILLVSLVRKRSVIVTQAQVLLLPR